ncbi:MAG: hypothetical protein JWO06_2598 [Bacteroidota bacterium]|nr:hypothetical protein [Bacteroidota bacterium]
MAKEKYKTLELEGNTYIVDTSMDDMAVITEVDSNFMVDMVKYDESITCRRRTNKAKRMQVWYYEEKVKPKRSIWIKFIDGSTKRILGTL